MVDSDLFPTVVGENKVGDVIGQYKRSDTKPTVVLSCCGTVLNMWSSPVVAAFSLRRPNMRGETPDVWLSKDTRKPQFSNISGNKIQGDCCNPPTIISSNCFNRLVMRLFLF